MHKLPNDKKFKGLPHISFPSLKQFKILRLLNKADALLSYLLFAQWCPKMFLKRRYLSTVYSNKQIKKVERIGIGQAKKSL